MYIAALLCAFFVAFFVAFVQSLDWNLPVTPSNYALYYNFDKRIPRHLWLTFRYLPNAHDQLKPHLRQIIDRQEKMNWFVHLTDETSRLAFLEKVYRNTSLLWAYKMIHPHVGVAKADLWRYAVLWYYGGAYIDDDSSIEVAFDKVSIIRSMDRKSIIFPQINKIIGPKDVFIVGVEKNKIQEKCYYPDYHLSTYALSAAYKHKRKPEEIFGGKILVTWAMFVAPGSVVLKNTMKNAVELIKLEYFRRSALMTRKLIFVPWMAVMCITGPRVFTSSAIETVLQYHPGNEHDLIEVKGGRDFHSYGGIYKIDDPNVTKGSHYMHSMTALLHSYLDNYELKVITANTRDFYFIYNGTRMAFDSWEAFMALRIPKREAVRVDKEKVNRIPLNSHLITVNNTAWVLKLYEIPTFKVPIEV